MTPTATVGDEVTPSSDGEAPAPSATAPTASPSATSPIAATETAASDTSGGDVDACVLVDAADAASILGSEATIDTTAAGGFGEVSSCVWLSGSDALLVVLVFKGRQFYGGGIFSGAEPLEVGDEGFIAVEPNFGGVDVQFVKGDLVVSLSATSFGVVDVDGLPEAMTRVAEQAAERLP